MTTPSLFDAVPDTVKTPRFTLPKKSRTELVADYFLARPGQWIDGMVFEAFAGRYAWRSRIADARKLGMNIVNRQRRLPGTGAKVSEYKYIPEPEVLGSWAKR
jgi:hypothetical protein